MKEFFTWFGALVVGIVILFCVFTALNYAGLVVSVPLQNKKTEVTRSTNQYVTTKQTELMSFLIQYQSIEVKIAASKGDADTQQAYQSQATAILNQMRSEAATLRPDQVPSSVSAIIQ